MVRTRGWTANAETDTLKEARGLDDVHFEGDVAGEHLNALRQGAAFLEMPSE